MVCRRNKLPTGPGEGKDICDSTNGAINRVLNSARKKKSATLMTAHEVATQLHNNSNMDGLVILCETERDLDALQRLEERKQEVSKKSRNFIENISKIAWRMWNANDDSVTLRETALDSTGQIAPADKMKLLRDTLDFPEAGIGLQFLRMGSLAAVDASTPPVRKRATGSFVMNRAGKAQKQLKMHEEQQSKKAVEAKKQAEQRKQTEQEIRKTCGGYRCSQCCKPFAKESNLEKHKCESANEITDSSKCTNNRLLQLQYYCNN